MLLAKNVSILLLSLLIPSAVSIPTTLPNSHNSPTHLLLARQDSSCADTCGSTCYTATDISAAQAKGYELYQEDETEGSDDYPHQYKDYEGFDFPVDGPWYEFPILSSGEVYSGGSPGADRVVFNGTGDLAGVITHTGASDDDFLQCVAGDGSDGGDDGDAGDDGNDDS